MLLKFLFCAMSLVAAVGAIKCYFCNDDRKHGNCEDRYWPVFDCDGSCVAYEAKIAEKPKRLPQVYAANYMRRCVDYPGEACSFIKSRILDTWFGVPEFHCEECYEDYCNNRANHPGTKLTF
ncbi:unnamed protein product [Ceutorhynchus assimilis]|uniref:Protein sleepless n=1 Tax=Ceutorhynchus assimilis TaxID=467358 RepID=A0A9N9MKK2_9CUCU|nr:unnamed protein product [Ceutorhynchus assimilis]